MKRKYKKPRAKRYDFIVSEDVTTNEQNLSLGDTPIGFDPGGESIDDPDNSNFD